MEGSVRVVRWRPPGLYLGYVGPTAPTGPTDLAFAGYRGFLGASTLLARVRAAGTVLPLATVLLLVVGGGWASPPTAPTTAPATAGGGPHAPFAVRAGYDPTHLRSVAGIRPAEGVRTVDVVFSPRVTPTTGSAGGFVPGAVAGFADRFGLTPSAFVQARDYFASYGLDARPLSSDRLGLELTGGIGELERAFRTTLLAGTVAAGPVTFPATPPSLPTPLENEVAAVVGLASGFDTFSLPVRPLSAAGAAVPVPSAYLSMPGRIRDSYGLSQLYNLTGGPANASGHAVAVVLWGAGYAPSDLATFFSQYYPASFPAPNIVPYPVDNAPSPGPGALSSPDLAAVEELTLDLEWSASMAPGVTVDAVYTHDGPPPNYGPSAANLTTALEKALSLRNATNLTAISMSFGSPESSDAALIAAWNPLFSEARQLGVTVLAASGDTGGDTTACSGTASPEFPASSPDVIAVGGTNVTFTGPGASQFTESAWDHGGGGFSTVYAAPAWQEVGSAAGPIAANGHRGFPDVSGSAADDFLYFDGTAGAAAGTSFATPMWAGLVTDLVAKWGHPLGFFTDRLYHVAANETTGQIGEGLVDVVGGSNCVASAVAGWDAATGWGSPRAAVLFVDLLGSFVNLSLHVSPSPAAPGGTVHVRAVLTNRSSGAPIEGVPVVMTLSGDLAGGPCTGTFGSASPLTDANGSVSAAFSLPLCYPGIHAVVTVRVATVHYYGTNSSRVAVNLLGWFPQLAFLDSSPWRFVTFGAILGAAIALGYGLGRLVEPLPPRPRGPTPIGPTPPSVAPPPAPSPADSGTPPPPAPAPAASSVPASTEGEEVVAPDPTRADGVSPERPGPPGDPAAGSQNP